MSIGLKLANLLLDPTTRAIFDEKFGITNKITITMSKRHHVSFTAHKKVKEDVHVTFQTKTGKPVSFDAEKKVEEPVRVDFMAKNKPQK